MKKTALKKTALKIIAGIILILVVGLFIRPQKVIYEARIYGIVVDENGNPLNDVTVSRIEEKSWKNKKWGYIEHKKYKSQTVKTNESGKFELEQKSRIDWLHTPLDLPFVWCYADFEVSKIGYQTYETKFDDYKSFSKEGCYACEEIEFKPKIILKKNIR